MFQFTAFAFPALCIQAGNDPCGPGFPIRTSPDQSLFTSSPRLFAGIHVLHRLFPPRHPPYALIHLTIYPAIPSRDRCPVPGPNNGPSLPHLSKNNTSYLSIGSAQETTIPSPLPTAGNPGTQDFLLLSQPAPTTSTRSGGADRDRTGDPRLAKPMLSQLSYSPIWWAQVDSNH